MTPTSVTGKNPMHDEEMRTGRKCVTERHRCFLPLALYALMRDSRQTTVTTGNGNSASSGPLVCVWDALHSRGGCSMHPDYARGADAVTHDDTGTLGGTNGKRRDATGRLPICRPSFPGRPENRVRRVPSPILWRLPSPASVSGVRKGALWEQAKHIARREIIMRARERQRAAGETHGRGQLRERLPEANSASQNGAGKARDHAAKLAGRTADRAS